MRSISYIMSTIKQHLSDEASDMNIVAEFLGLDHKSKHMQCGDVVCKSIYSRIHVGKCHTDQADAVCIMQIKPASDVS